MWSERSQSQKTICCMTIFICNSENRKSHRGRKKITGFQGLGWEGGKLGITAKGIGFPFGMIKMFQNYW